MSKIDPAAENVRRYSPALFAIIGLAFLLPFVSVQCAGQNIVTIKGIDLVLGGEVEISKDLEEAMDFGDLAPVEAPTPPEDNKIDPNIFAIVALAGAVGGLILSLIFKGPARAKILTIEAGVLLLALVILAGDLSGDTGEVEGAVEVKYRYGYWIALLGALALTIAYWREWRKKPEVAIPPAPPPP